MFMKPLKSISFTDAGTAKLIFANYRREKVKNVKKVIYEITFIFSLTSFQCLAGFPSVRIFLKLHFSCLQSEI